MERMRPLSENDCYIRLYGQREPTVTIISRAPRANPGPTMTGAELLEAFDAQLAARDVDRLDAEAA